MKEANKDYISRDEFNQFLLELSVTLADLSVSPEFAFGHFNNHVYDFKTKTVKLKGGKQ